MEYQATRPNLERFVTKERIVRADRPDFFDRYTTGLVVDYSKELVLMRQFNDFVDFGWILIRVRDIDGFRCGEYEEVYKKILINEGFSFQTKSPLPNVDDWASCFGPLGQLNQLISMECEVDGDEENEGVFYAGIPSQVEGDTVWFLGCDALGRWDSEEEGLDLRSMVSLQFDSPYLKALFRYMTLHDTDSK